MSSPPIMADGLWRCLCPSYTAITSPFKRPQSFVKQPVPQFSSRRPFRSSHSKQERQAPFELPKQKQGPNYHEYRTDRLHEILRVSPKTRTHDLTSELVSILVHDRHEKPNNRLFTSLITANLSPNKGHSGRIKKYVDEMMSTGMELEAGLCHDILEVLAVHPDYLLLEQILEHMQQRWFTLTEWGHNLVVCSLLRSRQFELALSRMDKMESQNIRVHVWLQDMTFYILSEEHELDEAFEILQKRAASNIAMSDTLWLYALDVASSNVHYQMTRFVWGKRVELGFLTPSFGQCLNVLNTVSRQGDVRLATDVFRILSERNAVFDKHDYELLLAAYLNAGDLKTALSVLCVMENARKTIDRGSTRSLFKYLRESADGPAEAFEVIHGLQQSGEVIPTMVMNTIIEVTLEDGDLEGALVQFEDLPRVCKAGPDTVTFDLLLKGCRELRRKDLAMRLAAKMVELKIVPSSLTYSRLIQTCLQEKDNYDDAVRYYDEMMAQRLLPSYSAYKELLKRLADAKDPRAFEIMSKAAKDKYFVDKDLTRRVLGIAGKGPDLSSNTIMMPLKLSNSNG